MKYDLFELFPDGYVLWRGTIQGLWKAIVELKELAAHTKYEMQLMYSPTNALIAKMNVPTTDQNVTAFPPDRAPPIVAPSADERSTTGSLVGRPGGQTPGYWRENVDRTQNHHT